ncbi:CCR4-NOT transcription complex subunit 1-like [Populus alba x Populus x berolinensis]|uniref:CCR4-NOT transcription complex subunit 1-like n=2 Tax=Populus alba x Populus x berolinensis TaxID=444605 RepID=A0AAD6WHU2_9ROSI|nr:CCR4-NOT transcription complex subunit 1-like [Populus alba x Populus x berolinensis]
MEKYLMNLDTEERYLFLNAIADQLRYPRVFLFLWSSVSREIIQEQITRMLFERLIVSQHHPWGPLITFMELIKNPRYKFWDRGFTTCEPEIAKHLRPLSRSCARHSLSMSLSCMVGSLTMCTKFCSTI